MLKSKRNKSGPKPDYRGKKHHAYKHGLSATKEYLAAKTKAWRLNHPIKQKFIKKRSVYGISRVEFLKLKRNQGHSCKVCRLKQKLQIDHNHTTGKVRGLLCRNCNLALGFAKENLKILKELIRYVKNGN